MRRAGAPRAGAGGGGALAGVGVEELKRELLALCGGGQAGKTRVEAAQRVEDIVEELERRAVARGVEEDSAIMEGRWRLLTTFVPGQAAAEFTSLDSWREYVFAKGPSPVQAAIFTNELAQRVFQVIDLVRSPGRWHNVVDARPYALACIQADVSLERAPEAAASALRFQWTGGFISVLRLPWSGEDLAEPVRFPYPVPFQLLGDRARGTFDTVYLDRDLRIARGSKSGSVFVLVREAEKLPLEEAYYTPAV